MMRPLRCLMFLCPVFAPVVCFAQTALPAFEVASIKANTGGGRGAIIRQAARGRFTAENAPAELLIQLAYNVQTFQLSGQPAWIGSERYDITAKTEDDATLKEMRPMLQSLLADGFKLAIQRQTKELPVYDLVAAKDGLKNHGDKRRRLHRVRPGASSLAAAAGRDTPSYLRECQNCQEFSGSFWDNDDSAFRRSRGTVRA